MLAPLEAPGFESPKWQSVPGTDIGQNLQIMISTSCSHRSGLRRRGFKVTCCLLLEIILGTTLVHSHTTSKFRSPSPEFMVLGYLGFGIQWEGHDVTILCLMA